MYIRLNNFRYIPLILLIVFIPYSSLYLFGNPYLLLPMLMFFMYLILSINKIRILTKINHIKVFIGSIATLWIILLVSSLVNFNPLYIGLMRSTLQRILIYFGFFIIVYNELEHNPKLHLVFQKAIIFSTLLMGLLYFSGVGIEFIEGRIMIFGATSNTIAIVASTSIIMAFDIVFSKKLKGIQITYYIIVIVIAILLIALTGSRKAIIMLSVGVFVYYIFLNRTTEFKLKILIPLIVFGLAAFYYISRSEIYIERINSEMSRQDFGGRLPIWQATFDVIKSSPYFGVGIGKFAYQIENSLGRVRDAHNEFLQITAYGGIAGLLCLIIFLVGLFIRSWRILKKTDSEFTSLPLTLCFLQIIYFASAGGAFTNFYTWLIFAFIASKTFTQKQFVTEKGTFYPSFYI